MDATKNVIRKLMFRFKSESFENPALQREYRVLEALALDKEEPEEFTDHTKPNNELILEKARQELEDLSRLLYPGGQQPSQVGTKRGRADADKDESSAKKSRDSSDIDFEEMAKSGQVDKLTIPKLKQFLASVGKKTTGKKADLVQAVIDHFQSS